MQRLGDNQRGAKSQINNIAIPMVRLRGKEGAGMGIWIVFIISLVLSVIIVNAAQNFYMKMIGADAMFFSGKKKLIAILVVALLIAGFAINALGIEIPN